MKSKINLQRGTGSELNDRELGQIRPCRLDSLVLLLGVFWLLASIAGFQALDRYSLTPGPVGPEASDWPVDSQLVPSSEGFTLLYFAHPRCPCTRAGLGELEQLLVRTGKQLKAQVIFYRPAEEADDWARTGLWERAELVAGISVRVDAGGEEARRFGVATSGETLLYDNRGSLRFHGGITAARGHSGDNPGRTSLQDYFRTGTLEIPQTPVFGCSLTGVN